MKRSSSEVSLTSSTEDNIEPDHTSISKKPKNTTSPSKAKSPKKPKKEGEKQVANGEWTEEKRAVFMDMVIAAGYKALNLDEVAITLGMSKRQLVNQLTTGRKGSFREKAVLAVSGA